MYLDPGFGGMLLQLIVALIAMGGAIIFSMRKKISKAFKKDKTDVISKEQTTAVKVSTDEDTIDVLKEDN